MLGVTALCVIAAATPAVDQLLVAGWRGFIARPAGVGASDSGTSRPRQATAATPKTPALTTQPRATPSPTASGQPTPPSTGPSPAAQPPDAQPPRLQPPVLKVLVLPRRPGAAPPPRRAPPPPSEHLRHRWRG
jgi:hypothetical protein